MILEGVERKVPNREDLDGYTIAVIIPCYNESQTIGKVIDDLLLALLLVMLGVAAGIPVISDYMATGLVPKLPSAVLAVGLVTIGVLSMLTGIILDTIAKNERMRFENEWMRELAREQATPLNGCTKLTAPFSSRYLMPDMN